MLQRIVSVIIIGFLVASSSILASSVYVSGHAGGGSTTVKNDITNTVSQGGVPISKLSSKRDAGITGIFGGGAIGISKKFNKLYVAGEARGSYDPNSVTIRNVNNADLKVVQTVNFIYDLSFIPGYFVTPRILIFGRIGAAGANFKSKFTGDKSQSGLLGFPGTFNKQIIGGVFGFGIQAFIMQQLALALEYNYFHFFDFDKTTKVTFGPSNDPFLSTTKFNYKVRSNRGLLSIIYYFSKPPEAIPPKVIPIHQALAVDNPTPKPYIPKEAAGALAPRLSAYYEERTRHTEVAGLSEPNLFDNAFQPNHAPLPNPELLGG